MNKKKVVTTRKKKNTQHNNTNGVSQPQYINFILDESGSMDLLRSATISGFNEYIKTLKDATGDILFTLTKFTTKIDNTGVMSMDITIPYVAKPIADVPELTAETYIPSNMTPLYDAVCTTIKKVEGLVKEGQPVLIAIMTDGQENSSKEFTQGELASMIQRLQKTGLWTFVFMGANQDSWETVQHWGIPKGNVKNWAASTLGVKSIMRSVGESTAVYAQSNTVNYASFGMGTTTLDFFAPANKKQAKENT